MKANEGTLDRVIRIVIGIVAAYGGYSMGGTLGIVLYVVAALTLITGVVGFCPAYALFGMNTCGVKK